MSTLARSYTLFRPALSSLAAGTAAAGGALAPDADGIRALVAACAVFLLACGASALNQVQERRLDAMMDRTKHRPVASGAMRPGKALVLALFLIAVGLVLLARSGELPAALGCLALFWYNGVYTFLKKRSAFAAVPGALVGAVPPAIGWTSAGGPLLDPALLALCILLFLWQVPHFWLLAIRYHDDYERAGLPTPFSVLSRRQVNRLTFIWIIAIAAATLALPLFGLVRSPALALGLLPAALWLSWSGALLLRNRVQALSERTLFGRINGYLLAVLASMTIFRCLEIY